MLRQISSVLRKFAYQRYPGSAGRGEYSRGDNGYVNLDKVSSSEELLKLMNDEMPSRAKPQALRIANTFMFKDPNSPLNRELFDRSKELFEESIANISDQNFRNLNNLMTFLVGNRKRLDLDFSELKPTLKRQVDYLLEQGSFDLQNLINASVNFSNLGWSSRTLDEALYQKLNDSLSVSIASLSKLIESYQKRRSALPVKLLSVISAKINAIPEKEFETTFASRILKNLSVLGDFMRSNKYVGISSKLSNILADQHEKFDIKDIINIYSFFNQNPYANKNLFILASNKLAEHLKNPIPKNLLMDVLGSIHNLNASGLNINKEIRELLSGKVLEVLKEPQALRFSDFKQMVESYSAFNNGMSSEFSDALKRTLDEQNKLTFYAVAFKPLVDLNAIKIESFIPQDKFLEAARSSNPGSKVLAYSDIAKVKNNSFAEQFRSLLADQIESDIEKPEKLTEYLYSLELLASNSVHINDNYIRSLAQKLLRELKNNKSHNDVFAIKFALLLSSYDRQLATEIYTDRNAENNTKIISIVLSQIGNKVNSSEILNLMNSIPEPNTRIIQHLLDLATEDSSNNYLYKVAPYVNLLKGSSIENMILRNALFSYLELCKEKEVYISLASFIKNLDDYLLSLDDAQLSRMYYLNTVGNLLSYDIPSNTKEFSRKLIKRIYQLHLPGPDSNVADEFMEVAAEYVSREKDFEAGEKILPNFFKIEGNIPLAKLHSKINAYVKWPKYESILEATFSEAVANRLADFRSKDNSDYLDLVSMFRRTKFGKHLKLREEILNALDAKVVSALPKFSKDLLINSLKEYSQFGYHKADSYFKTFSEVLLTRYEKLNTEDKATILEEFARRGYTNKDLLTILSNEISAHPENFYTKTSSILSSLCSLNFEQDPAGQAALNSLVSYVKDKPLTTRNPNVYFDQLFAMVKAKQPTEEIVKIVEKFNSADLKYTPNFKKALLNNHFDINPIGVELHRTPAEDKASNIDFFTDVFQARGFKYLTLGKLLHKKQIEYSPRFLKDKVFIPIYIPKSDTAIWIPGSKENTHDSAGLKGEFELHKQHIQAKTSKLVMMNASSFNDMKEEDIERWLESQHLEK
jgi:hypothetical protein